MKRIIAAVFLLLTSLTDTEARADFDPVRADEKRPAQDYGAPPPEAPGGAFAVAGRVILFPFHLISEFVLRRPIGWAVVHAEKANLPVTLYDFFTFGEDHQAGIFPSAFFDFGLLPSVGFNAYWREIAGSRHTARLHFGTWGPQWISLAASDAIRLSTRENLVLSGGIERRQDSPFYGMGGHSFAEKESRYGTASAKVDVGYDASLRQGAEVQLGAGVRSFAFKDGTCCSADSLTDTIAQGRLSVPPGFGQGYNALYNRGSISIDTRRSRLQSGSGMRLDLHGEPTFTLDKRSGDRRAWVTYGGSIGHAIDLTGEQRVLSLSVDTEFADPLQGTIPFTDQVGLGGDVLMRGFLRRRLVDRSAAVATLQYTWPVWALLDGVMHVAMGNVFGSHLDNWTLDSNRLSAGVGIRSNSSRESSFEILFAAGTDTFDRGGSLNSFRFYIGTHNGI